MNYTAFERGDFNLFNDIIKTLPGSYSQMHLLYTRNEDFRRGSRNFHQGGSNLAKKKLTSKKKINKIKNDKRGEGGRFSIYYGLVGSKSNL